MISNRFSPFCEALAYATHFTNLCQSMKMGNVVFHKESSCLRVELPGAQIETQDSGEQRHHFVSGDLQNAWDVHINLDDVSESCHLQMARFLQSKIMYKESKVAVHTLSSSTFCIHE